jgi:hypothetical protein
MNFFSRHISLCNPYNFENFLLDRGFKTEILFEQNRSLNPFQLEEFAEGLSEYFLKLNKENKCIFKIVSEMQWDYQVWLKKITSK